MRIALFIAAFWAAVVGGACLLGRQAHAACAPTVGNMRFVVAGDAIRAEGPITRGTAAWLAALVAVHHPHSLIIDSGGGDVGEAAAMADTIRLAGLDVSVPHGMCASACFMMFAAGRQRSVGPQTAIGVHRAKSCADVDSESQFGTDAEAAKAGAFGATPEILRLMTSTYQPEMAWLSRSQLAAMGVRFTP